MAKTVNVNENNSVAKVNDPQKNMKLFIQSMMPQITKALPSVITPERFGRICMTALSRQPELAQCTLPSFAGAMMVAAQLGLEPNSPLGEAYLIPYRNWKNGNQLECQFQLGYKGLLALAHRSGELQSIEAHVVYENDEFVYELGLEPKLVHKPAMKDRGEITWVYAVYRLVNGGYGFEVMSVDDINKHRKQFSKSKGGPWDTNWEEMAKKTVVKKVLKYAPLATEFRTNEARDGGIIEFKDLGDGMDLVQTYDEGQLVEAETEVVQEEQIDMDTGEVK